MIKAVIFDCDGLLVDSEAIVYDTYCDVYRAFGEELPFELYIQCVGTSLAKFDPLAYLANVLNKRFDYEKTTALVKKIYTESVINAGLLSGVEQYLQEAAAQGFKIGLASNSSREWVKNILTNNHIASYFDSIYTKDDVEHLKPHPEIYLRSLEALGVKKEEAIVFEDSLSGSTAAKAAGTNCVIIPNKMTAHFPFERFDLRLNSMSEMSLSSVVKQITGMNKTKKIS